MVPQIALSLLLVTAPLSEFDLTATSSTSRIVSGLERDITRELRRCDAARQKLRGELTDSDEKLWLCEKALASQEKVNVIQANGEGLNFQLLGWVAGIALVIGLGSGIALGLNL